MWCCRYVTSRSDAQLRGSSVSTASLHKSCDPQATLNGSAIIEPCGLIAWSYFNDTFQVHRTTQHIQIPTNASVSSIIISAALPLLLDADDAHV